VDIECDDRPLLLQLHAQTKNINSWTSRSCQRVWSLPQIQRRTIFYQLRIKGQPEVTKNSCFKAQILISQKVGERSNTIKGNYVIYVAKTHSICSKEEINHQRIVYHAIHCFMEMERNNQSNKAKKQKEPRGRTQRSVEVI